MNETVTLRGYDALQARFKRLGHVDKPLLRLLGTAGVREAKARVRRKTSNLSRTIGSEVVGEFSVRLYARANYARDVEEGTRPHVIRPKNKKALRFAASSGGARLSGSARKGADVVFARVVHHPGTKPHPFLLPGAKAAIEGSGLAKEIVAVWDGRSE
jgi:hypothetical protein